MSVIIGAIEIRAIVEPSSAVAPQAVGAPPDDSVAAIERTRRRAERAVRITRRTQSEGYDD